jgi:hypothetical protein
MAMQIRDGQALPASIVTYVNIQHDCNINHTKYNKVINDGTFVPISDNERAKAHK